MKYPEDGVLYLEAAGGLCNRLLACTATLPLAKTLGKRLVILWAVDSGCGCRLEELFLPIPGADRVISLYNKPFWRRWQAKRYKRIGYLREPWIIRGDILLKPEAAVNLAARLAPYPWVYLEALNNFMSVPFSAENFRLIPSLQTLVDEQTSAFTGRMVGVHVRRTDNAQSRATSTDERFITRMNAELATHPTTRFFLATDSPETETFFRPRFPGKILTYHKRSLDRNSAVGIQDALVDLYCLSRTEKILGSFYSTFSQVAASLSGVALEIVQP